MTGLLALYQSQAGPTGEPLTQLPSDFGERFSAEMDAQLAPDRYFKIEGARREKWQDSIDALYTATGQRFENPVNPATPADLAKPGYNPALLRKERERAIIEAHRALQRDSGVSADLPDPETIDQRIGEEGRALRGKAAALENTGNGLGAFLGGALAPTPENIIGLMIPPSRAVLGAVPIARGFLYNVGREAAFQAGANAGLTAVGEALDVAARRDTGTAPDLGEIAANIGLSAAGGAILGGGFHALHLAPHALLERWNRLPEDVRTKAPLEVRDAMGVIESDALYSGRNRLGLPWDLHERYQGNALDAVMRGRPVALDELAPDSLPMTALARVLRQPEGVDIRGLPEFDRMAALPDSELEAFARQANPEAFKKIDRIEKDLDRARADLERARGDDPEGDVIDEALIRGFLRNRPNNTEVDWTKATPNLIEAAKRQGYIEGEGAARVTPETEAIEHKIDKLEKRRTAARATADQVVQELRARLDSIELGKTAEETATDLGFADAADFARALERAEFDRQARVVQAVVGERQAPAKATPTKEAAAVETEAKAVLEGRSALGDLRKQAKVELEAIDQELRDAQAALSCAGGGA